MQLDFSVDPFIYLFIKHLLITYDVLGTTGTEGTAVDQYSLWLALLELIVWWENRTIIRRALTGSGVELFSRNYCYFKDVYTVFELTCVSHGKISFLP